MYNKWKPLLTEWCRYLYPIFSKWISNIRRVSINKRLTLINTDSVFYFGRSRDRVKRHFLIYSVSEDRIGGKMLPASHGRTGTASCNRRNWLNIKRYWFILVKCQVRISAEISASPRFSVLLHSPSWWITEVPLVKATSSVIQSNSIIRKSPKRR